MPFIVRIYYSDGTPPDLHAGLDQAGVTAIVDTLPADMDHVEIVQDPGTDPFNPETNNLPPSP